MGQRNLFPDRLALSYWCIVTKTAFNSDPITFTITPSLIAALQSGNGGWSRDALAILGVAWPPRKGWRTKVIGKRVKILQGSLDAALERAQNVRNRSLTK